MRIFRIAPFLEVWLNCRFADRKFVGSELVIRIQAKKVKAVAELHSSMQETAVHRDTLTTERCPSCRRVLRVPKAFSGLQVQCCFCQAEFWLAKRFSGNFRAECPGCAKNLRIPKRFAGHRVECNGCGKAFVAPLLHRLIDKAKTKIQKRRRLSSVSEPSELPEDHVLL